MTIQSELDSLKQQLDESRSIAFQAMNYSSDLGTILLFIEESFSIASDAELINSLLGVLSGQELEAVVCTYINGEIKRYSAGDEMTQDESRYIETTRLEHRIASDEAVTVFNYEHISCLLRNMPIENQERYGMLKDTVATLLNGVEARLKTIQKDQLIAHTQEELLALTEHAMLTFEKEFATIGSEAQSAMSRLMDDVRGIVNEIDVCDKREKEVLTVVDTHVGLINKITRRSESIELSFESLKHSIDKISKVCDVEKTPPPPQKPATFDSDSGSIELF
ncbi:MAG: hypothetical protein AAF434_00230 [Pseudomonadota bacterium]